MSASCTQTLLSKSPMTSRIIADVATAKTVSGARRRKKYGTVATHGERIRERRGVAVVAVRATGDREHAERDQRERGGDERVDDPRVQVPDPADEAGQPDRARYLFDFHGFTVRRRRRAGIDLRATPLYIPGCTRARPMARTAHPEVQPSNVRAADDRAGPIGASWRA